MGYNNLSLPTKGFTYRLRIKIGRLIAKSFPLNSIRILGLKLCGYKIGNKVYVGEETLVVTVNSEDSCHLTIMDRVAIAPRVMLILASDANWSKLMNTIDPIRGSIIIEDDVWLGAGSIILPNVKIGHSSIVAAGAVVTKDVPPNSVVSGIPAKILKTLQK